jgi:uncharacterized protein (TIGR03067 family)
MRLGPLVIVLGLLLGTNSFGQPASDLKELEGTWKLQGSEKLLGTLIIQKDKKYIYKVLNYREIGTFNLDPDKKPKQIHFFVTEGPDKGKTRRGIYEFTKSGLMLCLAKLNDDPPPEFKDNLKRDHILWKGTK